MKKTILSLVLVAFAFAPALQAGDGKESPQSKAGCPMQAATCPMQKVSCSSESAKCEKPKSCCTEECKAGCGAKKARVAKKTNLSVKGAQLLVQR